MPCGSLWRRRCWPLSPRRGRRRRRCRRRRFFHRRWRAEPCRRSKTGCRASRPWSMPTGQAGGRIAHADGEPQGHPDDGGLRLCPAGRLHARARDRRPTSSNRSMSRTAAIFTLHLRKGMKWSDGQPFTAEDFRYWFEDVAKNPQLSPSGLPVRVLPKGQPPRFEVLDDTTVRYSWARPNPLFLPALAGARPAVHLLPCALSEAVPREICRQGQR